MISLVVVGLATLVTGFATPIFAHSTVDDEESWEARHKVCESGDWEAMAEWHAQYHGAEGTMNEGMMKSRMMGNGMMDW